MAAIRTIVLDNGPRTSTSGFAGDNQPAAEFPTVVGCKKNTIGRPCEKEIIFGNEAINNRNALHLSYPIEVDIVTNWDNLERLWHHTLYTVLQSEPEEHPMLVTEPPRNPLQNREKVAEIMFDTFTAPALYLANQEALAMRCTNRNTGLVVHLGDQVSKIVPVYEGHPVQHCDMIFEIADTHLKKQLINSVKSSCGVNLDSFDDVDDIANIQNKLWFVSSDYANEPRANKRIEYTLLSNETLYIENNSRFTIAEGLFKPSLLDMECINLPEIINLSISRCNAEIHTELLNNILLIGKSTKLTGLSKRLESQLNALNIASCAPSVTIAESEHPIWLGGSTLGSSEFFQEMLITRAEYDEYGPVVLKRKCF